LIKSYLSFNKGLLPLVVITGALASNLLGEEQALPIERSRSF